MALVVRLSRDGEAADTGRVTSRTLFEMRVSLTGDIEEDRRRLVATLIAAHDQVADGRADEALTVGDAEALFIRR